MDWPVWFAGRGSGPQCTAIGPHCPGLRSPLRRAGLAQPSGVSPADDNAAILALGTQKDDRLARLRAGEATSVVLLTATAMGLACCPISEPLEIRETREAVRADVFGASGHPQMLLRVGWAPINADPLPSTPRRRLSHVVEWPGLLAQSFVAR